MRTDSEAVSHSREHPKYRPRAGAGMRHSLGLRMAPRGRRLLALRDSHAKADEGEGMNDAAACGNPLVARVRWGGMAAFAIHISGAGLTYCAQLAIARVIGADNYGIYAYVFAWMTVLAYFSALGFDVSLLRFVPAYHARRAWSLLRGVIQYAERRVAVVGCAAALIGAALVAIWAGERQPQLTNTFLVGFILVPVLGLLWIRSSVVRAFGGVVSALAPDRIVRDGTLLLFVVFAGLVLGWEMAAPAVMMATVTGSVIGLGLVTLSMRRLRPRAVQDALPTYAAADWRQTALPLVIIGAAEALMNRTGVMLLGWAGDTKDAGIYSLAFNIAFLAVLPRTAINTLLAPAISELFAKGDRTALQALIGKATLWSLLGALSIALPVALLADPLLTLFGRDFGAGASMLRILLIGQVIAAGAGSQLYLMTMTGHERRAAALLVSSALANAIVSAALIGPMGPTGPAVAVMATLIAWNGIMALHIWRQLGLLPGVLLFFRWSFGRKKALMAPREDVIE
jgi:O-antigen/teichoic acid export membrane protein